MEPSLGEGSLSYYLSGSLMAFICNGIPLDPRPFGPYNPRIERDGNRDLPARFDKATGTAGLQGPNFPVPVACPRVRPP